jgi:hypothetical protein
MEMLMQKWLMEFELTFMNFLASLLAMHSTTLTQDVLYRNEMAHNVFK